MATTQPMSTEGFLDALAADGARLAEAAAQAEWAEPVPGIAWDLRELFVHTGAVHRWSADIVRRGSATNETGGSSAFHPELPDDALQGWYADGLAALLSTLADAPADLTAYTFGAPVADVRRFWCRRQAHETAIHRVDAEAAAGLEITAFAPDLAQDGLDELLAGFARGFRTDRAGRLALLASDGDDWLVRFGQDTVVAATASDAAALADVDASVSGTSSDLYRWAWNRPVEVAVEGDPAVAALCRQVRIT